MSGGPLWFGPADCRLFGWLHLPPASNEARGAVLLCPPIGYEYIGTHRTYRLLARQLVAAGFAVLRFDYAGTGNSIGSERDPQAVDAWLRSIAVARDELRSRSALATHVIGMRAGALLAAQAATSDPADLLVLWDPPSSGRRLVREAQLLGMVGYADAPPAYPDGSFDAAGFVFTADTIRGLEALDLTNITARIADRVLLASRPERPPSKRLVAALGRDQALDQVTVTGQEMLVDIGSPHAVVPEASIAAIASWLDAHAKTDLHAIDEAREEATVVGTARDGRPIVETAHRYGTNELFAITTEPQGGGAGRWALGLNNAVDHNIGPHRLWVGLARDLAARGGRFARVDTSGIGESGVRPGQREHEAYAPESFEDVVELAAALSPDDPHDVTLVGLCSGAYLSIDVAAVHGVADVFAVNPVLDYKPGDLLTGGESSTRASRPVRWWMRALSGREASKRISAQLPAGAWWLLDRLRLHESPARGVQRALAAGSRVHLVFGDIADDLPRLRRRAGGDLGRFERRHRFQLETVAGLDHAATSVPARRELQRLLLERLDGRSTTSEATRPSIASTGGGDRGASGGIKGRLRDARWRAARRWGAYPTPTRANVVRVMPAALLRASGRKLAARSSIVIPADHFDVLVLVPSIGYGGAEQVAISIVVGLVEAGTSVLVVVTDQPEPFEPDQWTARASAHAPIIGVAAPSHFARAAMLAHVIDALRPDVVLLSNSYAGWDAARALRPRGATTRVIDIHHGVLDLPLRANPPRCLRPSRPFDLHLCVSSNDARWLVDGYDYPPDDVMVIDNGIELPDAPVSPPAPPPLRVGFVGRLDLQKRPWLVLETAALVAAAGLDAVFHLYGDGPLADETRSRAADLPNVVVHGRLDDTAAIYRDLHVLLLPSGFEGQPLTILEALAYGVVPIATAVGAVADTITDGVDGFLLPADGGRVPAAATAAIATLLGDEDLRRQMARCGRATALERFDVARMRKQYVDVVRHR